MVAVRGRSRLKASSVTTRGSRQDEGKNGLPLGARRHQVVHEIELGFRRACHGQEPGPVVLAVSGGRDSLALLIASAVLRDHDDFAILPRVVHVHHHLRPEADDEADHVLKVAAMLDIPAEVRNLELSDGTPDEARRLRYEALVAGAVDCRSGLVATGHHAEDQLETILAALGRGAGPGGLAGMPRSRGLSDGVSLIRPLLGICRNDAADLCRAADIRWCDDPGNANPDTQRGRLRRDVLPVLEEMWPGVASRVAATADLQAIAATAMDGLVGSVFGPMDRMEWVRQDLRDLPTPVIASGLRRAILSKEVVAVDDLSHVTIFSASEAVGDHRQHQRCFEVGSGSRIIVNARHVRIETPEGDS
ncbi:MAG: tRNA lysidine(34) synthetase TilS [Phycisphaerae bacterium]|nr:tRNA lysidine(34) synthetase TilS [Phycisphaerae bacterium]